ncbi:UNVERIFIED_CONTAM: hypothetical protein NCL1_32004 [Trichonephila clavipes]
MAGRNIRFLTFFTTVSFFANKSNKEWKRGYFLKRNLEHTQWDIEDNLDQLEGGWLGDNGFDDENSDDECHDSDEIRVIRRIVFNYHQK